MTLLESNTELRARPDKQQSAYFVFEGMTAVIHSPSMRYLLQQVQRAAQSNASILITGETGTGKELVARAIHHFSTRTKLPFIDVNCAALPEHLIESELFGFEKGAFSGAEQSKPGLFELANNGTLFLDEIGELEPKMQVKLFRVLDHQPHYRLGGTKKISVDVRVIAATNRDLEENIASGSFRSDLFHRLGEVQFHVPSLRERREDIEPLAAFFLKLHDPSLSISPEAIQVLESHSWPGNLRELRNCVIQAAILCQDDVIRAEDLQQLRSRARNSVSQGPTSSLEEMEKRMILQVLGQTDGNRIKTAALLGISRRTLSRKLKAYGIADSDSPNGNGVSGGNAK